MVTVACIRHDKLFTSHMLTYKKPDLQFERTLWQNGIVHIAGLDEAGRGAWAGPVTAGAVIFPASESLLEQLHGVRDSKQMTPRQREEWVELIRSAALSWGVGSASCGEIDALGILPATHLAMRRALEALILSPQHLLVDALRLPGVNLAQSAIIHGDARSLTIAAASVLAKTSRDGLMVKLDHECPGYGFARHKGYGTRAHQEALLQIGVSAHHRRRFAPIRVLLSNIEGTT